MKDIKDDLAFEFFNIILPATRVEDTIGNIKELVASGDIDSEVEDNLLKAELYVANLAQKKVSLSTKILCQISKVIYGRIYSWAGKLKMEARPAMEDMMLKISSDWQGSLLDEELRLDLLAFAYHCILKNKPFFDGNEKVARIFVNYLGLKYGTCLFNIAPSKKDEVSYKKFCKDLELADRGNILPIKERIRSVMFISSDSLCSSKLGPSASVKD